MHARSSNAESLGGPPIVWWANRSARLLAVNDALATLSPDQATIMDCLLTIPGRVVPLSDIVWAIWGDQNREEPDTAMNAIKVHICRLRKLGLVITNIRNTYNGRDDSAYVLGSPECEYLPDSVYESEDGFHRWKVLRVEPEPHVVLWDERTREQETVPLSALRHWKLRKVAEPKFAAPARPSQKDTQDARP